MKRFAYNSIQLGSLGVLGTDGDSWSDGLGERNFLPWGHALRRLQQPTRHRIRFEAKNWLGCCLFKTVELATRFLLKLFTFTSLRFICVNLNGDGFVGWILATAMFFCTGGTRTCLGTGFALIWCLIDFTLDCKTQIIRKTNKLFHLF